jgi:5-hydroxyisourate hydrolase-like protein (transthyretin family)
MKKQPLKKLFACLSNRQAFIIATIIFSVVTVSADAQNKPDNIADSKIKGGSCNCNKRPIPFSCGQICGARTTTVSNTPGSQSVTISLFLQQAEKLSVKIFDLTGHIVKSLADKIFEQGEHKLLWDAAGVNAGIYIVQFNTGTYSESKKIVIVK